MQLFTIGVYGLSESDFFEKIKSAEIDIFSDVRMRRGMRGSQYSFVNSTYLQSKLKLLEVSYVHFKGLAPTQNIRSLQGSADSQLGCGKRLRERLSAEFCKEYKVKILDEFDFAPLLNLLAQGKVCLFCVERDCFACHRSLIADHLASTINGLSVTHL